MSHKSTPRNFICIDIGVHTPEEYAYNLHRSVTGVLKTAFSAHAGDYSRDEVFDMYVLIDFIERLVAR